MTNPSSSVASTSNRNRFDRRIPVNQCHDDPHGSIQNYHEAPSVTKGSSSAPHALSVETWLLQGGGGMNRENVPKMGVPSSSVSKASKFPTKREEPPNQHTRTIHDPFDQPSPDQRHTKNQSRGRSPNHRSPPSSKRSSAPTTAVVNNPPVSPHTRTSTATSTRLGFTETSKVPSSPACPIPPMYVSLIRRTFGGAGGDLSSPIDLYTHVLGLPHQPHPYTDTQIRVAYFRQGRSVIQQHQQSSSPNSTIIQDSDATTTTVMPSSKLRFQAITKAYEIVTNPIYRAHYDTYGLPPLKPDAPASTVTLNAAPSPLRSRHHVQAATTAIPSPRRIVPLVEDRRDPNDESNDQDKNNPPVAVVDDDDDNDDNEEDTGSVASMSSILRNGHQNRIRSKSWGPASSSTRQRVVWKEVVQELIYQPDPPSNQSIDLHDPSCVDFDRQAKIQQEIEDRDFLDELEEGVNGIGATIGSFVKYLSEHDVANHSIEVKNDDDNEPIGGDEGNRLLQTERIPESNIPHQRPKGETREPTYMKTAPVDSVTVHPISSGSKNGSGAYAKRIAEYNRRSHSCDGSANLRRDRRQMTTSTTSTAPLKEGKNDQEPRTKPKKSKRKKKKIGVDKVPSNMIDSANDVYDPFQNSLDESIDFGAVDPFTNAMKSPAKDTVCRNTKFDAYDLPEISSILASLDGESQATQPLDFGAEKAFSFDDALDRTTDATTKGYIRLDRRANSLSEVVGNRASLDVSDVTYSSNASDDPAGRHFHFSFLSSIARSASTTIKEIASFDEEDDDAAAVPVSKTPKSKDATHPPNDVDIVSQFNTFMQSFVEDMNKLGTRISSNLMETNRVVRDNMTFPEAEVSGFLQQIGSGLNFTTSKDQTDQNDLPQSFTY